MSWKMMLQHSTQIWHETCTITYAIWFNAAAIIIATLIVVHTNTLASLKLIGHCPSVLADAIHESCSRPPDD